MIKDIKAFEENWNNLATEKTNAEILKNIVKREVLQKAEKEIKKEMNRVKFIDDSDGVTNRFLDSLTRDLIEEALRDIDYEKENVIEELQEELLQEIKERIMTKYKHIYNLERGYYTSFYYDANKTFSNLAEFYDYFGIGE